MACMYGRCRRVVGVGVRCVWRWRTVLWRAMALWCVCGYGVQALGVRMMYVVYVSCGVRCVYRSMTW